MALKTLAELDSHKVKFWASSEAKLNDLCNCPNIVQKDLGQIHSAVAYLLTNWQLPTNKKRFRSEGKEIYAMKAGTLRLYGFFSGNSFIVVHCIRKKSGKLKTRDLDTSVRRMNACLAEQAKSKEQ